MSSTVTPRTIRLALSAVSTTLVCVATIIFSIYLPDTKGYFNIGETVIFTTALLLGPTIGAFAGGVGASLADVFLGYWYFAPATLAIKAAEGAVIGMINRGRPRFKSRRLWQTFTLSIGLAIGTLLAAIGTLYVSGTVELSLGIPSSSLKIVTYIPVEFWYVLAALVVLAITITGFVIEPELGWPAFSTLAGGAVMVAGYFIYESFLLFPLFGIEVLAPIAEVPFNIGQVLVGLIVALPVFKVLKHNIQQFKSQARDTAEKKDTE